MFAAGLQKAVEGRAVPSVVDAAAVPEQMHAQLTMFREIVGITSAAAQAFARGRFAHRIAWQFYPWSVRLCLRAVNCWSSHALWSWPWPCPWLSTSTASLFLRCR